MTNKSKKPKGVNRSLVALADAVRLNRPPGIFAKFLADVRREGLVGEQQNALVLFLVATSRLLPQPANLFVKGPSSGGKNFLATRVLRFVPDDEVVTISSTTETAWNYQGSNLAHKIVYVPEENKAAGNIHPARLIISEKEITRMVTVREGKSFKTEKQTTKGPIACISTTTKSRLQIDDENRQLSVFVDDSAQQTKRILEARAKREVKITDDEISAWHGLQAVLAERAKLQFKLGDWLEPLINHVWADDVRIRRYFPAFEELCKTVALIRSLRFSDDEIEQKQLDVGFADFAIANLISSTAFSQSLTYPDESDVALQRAISRISEQKGGAGISALDIAQDQGISEDQAYKRLRDAYKRKAIQRINKPARGNKKLYLPSQAIQMLPPPEVVFRKLKQPEVSFRHPLTGKIIRYRKTREE